MAEGLNIEANPKETTAEKIYNDLKLVHSADEFIKYIDLYKKLSDKNSLDKNADAIRRQLTRLFNIIYTEVFQIALSDPTPPTIVKMFLHFGYVDLELAGINNAAYLYSIAKNYQGDPANGIYTLYEWITAIYKGQKQPSRNELSQDYSSYVHTLRAQGKIDAKGVQKMLDDTTGKVMYELESMFPSVNKITQGHFTTFCPIFIQENVVKDLSSILITSYKLKESLNKLLEIDFSAFYRSYLYADDKLGLRENVLLDIHPDFIIMPNVGSNGICWQEIEGMQRSTPGRMMISAIHTENIEKTFVRMTGEFRWEMCKRIQGYRWNDIATYSLTSEYFDYVQFYKKNRSLTAEAKERIKNNLQRAKNSFKEMFIRDYIQWILFESSGTPRLNKITRGILVKYCPFPRATRESLQQHPQYKEALERFETLHDQKLHHLNQYRKKLMLGSIPIPPELDAEIDYLNN